MFELIEKLRCEICGKCIKINEYVIINKLNGVVHQKCYWKEKEKFKIKDRGKLKEILVKHFSNF